MQEKEVRRILILNREKRLVGVVSLGDIARTSTEKELAGETLGDIAEAA
jgi:CBS domain-containing protein